MLKKSKELQEKIISLLNIFSNKFDNLVNSFNKEDFNSCHKNKNATSLWLLAIKKNRITGHFKLKEKIESINRDMSNISFLY